MGTNNTLEKINRVIEYIEKNIKEDITLDDISDNIQLSKYHLNRIFRSITNEQLMNYVRRRRLTSSINELINTDLKIIDIALEYRFEHEQSYIRSFKNCFSISPGSFRREKPALEIKDKLNLNYVTPIGEQGIIVEPKIIIKPEFYVIGIQYPVNVSENKHFYTITKIANDFYYNHRHKIRNVKDPELYIGVIQYPPDTRERCHYITSLEVTNTEFIPEGMVSCKVNTQKYAVFKYIGLHHPRLTTIDDLLNIYEYSLRVWLQNSDYFICSPTHLEVVDMKVAREDYCEVEIHIPVRKKNTGN